MDFWAMVIPLLGQELRTLDQRRPFRIEEIGDDFLLLRTSLDGERRIRRRELEEVWRALVGKGELTPAEIRRGFSEFNPAYVAAILAQVPGVGFRPNPITLFFKEEK